MEMTYRQEGDYQIPELNIENRYPDWIPGKFAMLRKHFLEEERHSLLTSMTLQGTLQDDLYETDQMAKKQLDQIVYQMAEKEGVNEALKAQNPMSWIQSMNSIRSRAEEMVIADVVYRG